MENSLRKVAEYLNDGANNDYRIDDFTVLLSRYAGYGAFSLAMLVVVYAGAALLF